MVRVEGVGEDTINLSFDLYYPREWSWDDVSAYVTEAITGYFLEPVSYTHLDVYKRQL